jgi:hypothetical protein
MKKILLTIFLVPVLAVPAFAGSSNAGDKPMVVAEAVEIGGVGVGVGGHHRYRHNNAPVVVIGRGHHHHHDGDRR